MYRYLQIQDFSASIKTSTHSSQPVKKRIYISTIPQKKRMKKKWASSHTPTPPLLDNTIHNEWQLGYALNTHHFDMVPWFDAVDSLSESDDKAFLFFFSPNWGFLTGLLNCTISSIKSESSSDLIVMKVEKNLGIRFSLFCRYHDTVLAQHIWANQLRLPVRGFTFCIS